MEEKEGTTNTCNWDIIQTDGGGLLWFSLCECEGGGCFFHFWGWDMALEVIKSCWKYEKAYLIVCDVGISDIRLQWFRSSKPENNIYSISTLTHTKSPTSAYIDALPANPLFPSINRTINNETVSLILYNPARTESPSNVSPTSLWPLDLWASRRSYVRPSNNWQFVRAGCWIAGAQFHLFKLNK